MAVKTEYDLFQGDWFYSGQETFITVPLPLSLLSLFIC